MASTKAKRQSAVATKAKPAKKPAVVERGAAISIGMKELAHVRSVARAKRNGTPAKPLVFAEWMKALLGNKSFEPAAIAKKFPDVKPSSVKAWVAYWRNNGGVGSGYPAAARGKEKEIKAALKKATA